MSCLPNNYSSRGLQNSNTTYGKFLSYEYLFKKKNLKKHGNASLIHFKVKCKKDLKAFKILRYLFNRE